MKTMQQAEAELAQSKKNKDIVKTSFWQGYITALLEADIEKLKSSTQEVTETCSCGAYLETEAEKESGHCEGLCKF